MSLNELLVLPAKVESWSNIAVNSVYVKNGIIYGDISANKIVATDASSNLIGLTSSSNPTFASENLTATTNQLVLGTTNTTTINSTTPSASRTYTIVDSGASANFIMSEGNQVINGTKSFSQSTNLTAITNQLVLGTTNTTTINSIAPTASRVYVIPDAGLAANFIMSESAQTINGALTARGGVLFDSSGGTPTNLNFYEYSSLPINASGPWASPQSVTFKTTRVGNVVTFNVTAVSAAATTGTIAVFTAGIGPEFYPSTDMNFLITVLDNGSLTGGIVSVFASDGHVTIGVGYGSNFAATSTAGWTQFGVSWNI